MADDHADRPIGYRPAPRPHTGRQRDERGRLLPGHTLSMRHGRRSPRVAAELFPERAAPLLERERTIVADLGGEVSTVRRELVTRFVQASAVADSLALNIVSEGILTGKGRTRASVTTFLQVLDRLSKLAVQIGLERKAKPAADIRAWAEERLAEGGEP